VIKFLSSDLPKSICIYEKFAGGNSP